MLKCLGRNLMLRECGICQLLLALLPLLFPSIVQADTKAVEQQAKLCRSCHNPDYRYASGPTLDGQPSEYLFKQLMAFKEKRRDDSAMQTNALGLSSSEMRTLAAYFSSRRPIKGNYRVDPAKVSQGKAIAAASNCGECHQSDYPSKSSVPRLAGMHPRYAANEIIAFTRGERPHPKIGRGSTISYNDAIALGQYFAQVE
jgi:cytochrome c553